MDDALTEIVAVLNAVPQAKAVQKSDVERWASSPELEALGALFALLIDRRVVVEPPMAAAEYDGFLAMYLQRCIDVGSLGGGEWFLSPYMAGHALADWIRSIDTQGELERARFWTKWLEGLYRSGADDVRDVVVNGVLEHVFESRTHRACFDSWRLDPELEPAWTAATEWVSKAPK